MEFLYIELTIISGWILLGATFITGIYNLFSYFQYRERVILNYCFYLFAISSYIFFFIISADITDEYNLLRYVRESANMLTIVTYCYFMYEAMNEWHKKYKLFFRLLRIAMILGLVYCSFVVIVGILKWRDEILIFKLPMAVRLVFLIIALFSVKIFFTRLKGPFLNLVKWGAVSYLSFVLIVVAGFFTPQNSVLGLDQMQWTFIGTFVEITLFSIAMSYKVKSLIARTQEIRDRISKDLHDEVGATLSGVTLMSELANQRLKNHKIEESQILIEKITNESKEMSEKMNDIVWTINPANDSMEKVLNKIFSYGKNICASKGINFHFEKPELTDTLHLDMHVRNNLYLISKEAVNNAVKYSEATNIRFSLAGRKERFILKIEDDGKGFNLSNGIEGNGLNNMRSRAVEIGGHLSIQSDEGNGTRLELFF